MFADSLISQRTSRRPLLLPTAAVAVGIALDRYCSDWWGVSVVLWWWGAGGCLLAAWRLRGWGYQRWASLLLLLAIVCVGGSWHYLRWHYYQQDHLARFATTLPQPVCVQALALDRLKYSPAPLPNPLQALPVGPRSELRVRVTRLRDGRAWRSVTGTCKLRIKGEMQGVMAGDELLVYAKLSRLPPALNPGEYDWAQVERGAGRHCELFCRSPSCVSVTHQATGWSWGRWCHKIGQRCEQRLSRYVRPAQRNLALAILLGARERLTAAERAAFLQTGTIHLLVVSGLHVGLLAMAIWTVVSSGLLPRRAGLVLSATWVIGYALVVGARPPVVRASVLVVLTLVSYAVGRRAVPTNLLAAAALVVLAINPSELFRSGTQLSFLCVATLIVYSSLFPGRRAVDPLQRLIRDTQPWHRKFRRWVAGNLLQTAAASLAIWLIVAPLVAYRFHLSAPISILITPLLWPLVAVALVAGLTICFVGWLLPPLAWCLGEACSLCLWLTESIITAARQLDGGNFYSPGPPGWWIAIFYGGLLTVALLLWPRVRWGGVLSLVLLWGAVGLVATQAKTTDEKLHCTFLAVGHGTCVVLQLPSGETLLYDAGSLSAPDRAAQTISFFLWSRGITQLDAVVLSHADVDHYSALPRLLERFSVGRVYVSPLMFAARNAPQPPLLDEGKISAPNFLKQSLEFAEVPIEEICANDSISTLSEAVSMNVLHPPRDGVSGSDNANSLLLSIKYAGHSILLPGDLESPGLEVVTAQRGQAVDILLAPHHGSRYSDPPGFANWCTPKWVVVSGPRGTGDQQFTTDSYRRVGAEVLHTSQVGAVEFVVGEQGIEWSQFLPEK